MDEIALYDHAIPDALIYKHFLNFSAGQPYSFVNDYTQPIPPPAPITAGMNMDDYAIGHPAASIDAITQLKTFPTPRYKKGNTLIRNFQWTNPKFLGGHTFPGVSVQQAVANSVTIQKELMYNFNYSVLASENSKDTYTLSDTNTFQGAWIKLANENPNITSSAISFWGQTKPADAGYPSSIAYAMRKDLHPVHYIKNAQGQYLSAAGYVTSNPQISPAAPIDSFLFDGLTQRHYFSQILSHLTRPLDYITDNGEVTQFYTPATMSMDPAIVSEKNSMGLTFEAYQATKKVAVTNQYRDAFMTLPGLANTNFTEYNVSGNDDYQPQYSISRVINMPINGNRYPTTSFYTRWPSNWRNWTADLHGWQWIVECRNRELALGDKFYSPYVSPGWDLNPELNVRPGQWLGLLKLLGMSGGEFYYTAFFNEALPYPDPKNYVWQTVMPSYAQAITSRYEDIFKNGDLMNGDVPNYWYNPTAPGYSFWTGDFRKLVVVRKHSSSNKYAITGTLQPSSNMINQTDNEDGAKIVLDGNPIEFNVRKQGSTYYFDNTNPTEPVFYQLDEWHEHKHPSRWSTELIIESELYDNLTANFQVKTQKVPGATHYNFINSTSYLTFNSVPNTPAEYYIHPRTTNQSNYYFWVKARSKSGNATAIDVSFQNGTAQTVGCISDTTWNWYRINACNQQPIVFQNLTNQEYLVTLLPQNTDVEIDKIHITSNQNLVLGTSNSACTSTSVNAVITTNGATNICESDSVVLTAGAASSYSWLPNGETTQSITVKTEGTYQVVVDNGSGCLAVSNIISVDVTPNSYDLDVVGSPQLCQGGQITLTSDTGSAYIWFPNGETTQSTNADTAGSYYCQVTYSNGCTAMSDTVDVTSNNSLVANITVSGPLQFCAGGSVTLTSDPGNSYFWTTGETTQSITVTATGSYGVVVNHGGNCFAYSQNISVTVAPPPTATLTYSGPTTFCQGGQVTITAPSGYSYNWLHNGSGNQTATVNTSGNYQVIVADGLGCTSLSNAANVTVNANPTPTITTSGPTNLCPGDNVTLTASNATTYNWNPNNQTSNSITVDTAGTYSVSVADVNGCTAISQPINVTVSSGQSASISATGPLTFCDGKSVTITASNGNSYLWSNGATTQSITTSTTGNYFVKIFYGSNCSSISNTLSVTLLSNPKPALTTNGPTTFCSGGSVMLTTNQPGNYNWNNGSSTPSITVNQSGYYFVTVTRPNGCINTSDSIQITAHNSPTANINPSGSTVFCPGDSVILTANNATSYNWFPNNETTQSIVVYNTGNYSVEVADVNSCTAVSNQVFVDVTTANIPQSIIAASGPTSVCQGNSVTMTANSGGSSYIWSNGETTQSITTSVAGNYFVEVYYGSTCSSISNSLTVTVLNNPKPIITANGPTTFCAGDSVTLSTSGMGIYNWHPNNESTQSIKVTQPGDYHLTFIRPNGCSRNSDTITVTVNNLPTATVTSNGNTDLCPGDSVELSVPSNLQAYWFPTGETTSSIYVQSAGNYYALITDANGCSVLTAPLQVTEKQINIPSITASGPTSFCPGNDVTLTGSSATNYEWFPSGETTQTILASTQGWYSFNIFEQGCKVKSDSVYVEIFSTPNVSIQPSGSINIDAANGVQIIAPSGYSYNWHPNGQTTNSINVNDSGLYYVTVMDANGCTGTSDSLSVSLAPYSDIIVISSGAYSFCEDDSINVSIQNHGTYLWLPSGETSQNVTISEGGNYTAIYTNLNGTHSDTAYFSVDVLPSPNTPSITSSYIPSSSFQLNAFEPGAVNYLWSNGTSTSSISVTQPGVYTVHSINAFGCSSPIQSATINSVGTQICVGPDITLASSISDTSAIISWNEAIIADSFLVYVYNSSINFSWYQMVAGNVFSIPVTALQAGTNYNFTISAICSIDTLISNTNDFTTLSGPLPCGSVPQFLSTTDITDEGSKLNWYSTTADRFQINYRELGKSTWIKNVISGSETYFALNGLSAETTYEWKIKSKCNNHWSPFSTNALFQTSKYIAPCVAPEDLGIDQIATSSARLFWDNNALGGDSLKVFLVNLDNLNIEVFDLEGNTDELIVSELAPNTNYAYNIKSICEDGVTSRSDTIYFKTLAIDYSLINLTSDNPYGLIVYPNPAKNFVQFGFKTGELDLSLSLMITDIKGQAVIKNSMEVNEGVTVKGIDITKLSSGVYNVTLTGISKRSTAKLIVY
ncbi:MAG: T9SS type A sorting domain-containing protein [Bacteroidia bacterium]|nr:T9SS type A sorting domain-containing protein [Bacteroidia bacterium]